MNAFGIASYGIAALSFLVLTLLLITAWRGRQQGAHLIVASGAHPRQSGNAAAARQRAWTRAARPTTAAMRSGGRSPRSTSAAAACTPT